MQIHYLYSDQKVVREAKVWFNGELQRDCVLVNDKSGFIVRRTFDENGRIVGKETLYGKVVIELENGYRTKEKVT